LDVSRDGKRSYTARFLREYLNGGPAENSKISAPALEEVSA
jgi:hypothetical protein